MLRVAAYARVSTEKDDQLNSLTNQRCYFEEYIKNHDDWQFAGVFYDEGITGTQTKKRLGFNKMIEAAKSGEIDLILTKEVSRFARNTVDTLAYTRKLAEYNAGVIFIGDNIDTRDGDGEFRLSIMASVAQEESRKTSERVKWGQRRAMENGVVFGNNSIYGYTLKDGQLTVNESEAEVVRRVFYKYVIEGKGTYVIARELSEAGIKPPRSGGVWSSTMVLRLLRNEKYVGDLLQKKYVTKNYLTHEKVINDSEDKIYLRDHHTPIVERGMWDMAQAALDRRRAEAEEKRRYSGRYWCSGKIVCGECGGRFTVRKSRRKSGDVYATWICRSCGMRAVNDKSLRAVMDYVIDLLEIDMESIARDAADEFGVADRSADVERICGRIKAVGDKRVRMLDSFFEGKISEKDMERLRDMYDDELARLYGERDAAVRVDGADLSGVLLAAVHSDGVYGEVAERITVYEECMVVRLRWIDADFKLVYSTHGYKDNYTTVIERCEVARE